jgi:hypothetical protein
MADETKPRTTLSIQTLLISALAAGGAATIVPMIWQAGTVIATAMTPVVVALVSEALRKPVQRVSTVAPRVARRTGTGAAMRRYDPDAARTREPANVGARGRGPERYEPLPPGRRGDGPRLPGDDPFGLRAADTGGSRRPRLKIALVTGLLAFVLAAAVVTASELTIFGGSVSGKRGATTLFSGGTTSKRKDATKQGATPTATPASQATPGATPSATATPQPSAAPSATATPAPSAVPIPTPTP